MKKELSFKKLVLVITLAGFAVGCDESTTVDGGSVYGDLTNGASTFGNLYKAYVSKTSAYAEVKFSGQIGAYTDDNGTPSDPNDDAHGNNSLMIPIWYASDNHYYVCVLSDASVGTKDPEIWVQGKYSDGTDSSEFSSMSIYSADAFLVTDFTEKRFGCELETTGAVSKVNAYLNGEKVASYTVGSSEGQNGPIADPGIASSSVHGRAGIGLAKQWGEAPKVHGFALYDKRPL